MTSHDRPQTPETVFADAAWLRWTDPETGERLRISVTGPVTFLTELEHVGFELERGTAGAAPHGRVGGNRHVRPGAGPPGGPRTGSTPPKRGGNAA